MTKPTIDIVGTGNVAFHFAKAIQESRYHLNSVHSRSSQQAEAFVKDANIQVPYSSGAHHSFEGDFVLICIPDEAILTVLREHSFSPESIVIHCSGATDLGPFREAHISKYGVVYPYQTLTAGMGLSMKEVPLYIEGGTSEDLAAIQNLASCMSDLVRSVDSMQRLRLHLAAVFATNFSNAMFHIAEELLHEVGEDFQAVHHLITTATQKAMTIGPHKAQTGPAVRGDTITIEKHLNSMSDEALKEIYQVISNRISNSKARKQ